MNNIDLGSFHANTGISAALANAKKQQEQSVANQVQLQKDFATLPIGQQKDPLSSFLNRGISESPDQLKQKYSDYFDSGNFGFKKPSGLGMDAALTDAVSRKYNSKMNDLVGREKGNLMRAAPMDFASRQQGYQSLAVSSVRTLMAQEANANAASEAAKQKRSGMLSGLMGLAGAGGGALIGGPAGALIGGGLGSSLGGLF